MAKRADRCGWCGELIRRGEATKFDTRLGSLIFHEVCFWGTCATKGWSYYQPAYAVPPIDIRLHCEQCDQEIPRLDPIWFERDGDGYWPYHPACAPSRVE